MNTQNTAKRTRDDRAAPVVDTDSADEPELSVADDLDFGGDPYNSTGRHVIIKSKLNLED